RPRRRSVHGPPRPTVPPDLRRRRRPEGNAEHHSLGTRSRQALPRRREKPPPLPRRQPREADPLSVRTGKPVPRLAVGSVQLAALEDAAFAAAVAVAGRGAGPLLPRPARAAGVLVPVEVPGHVAVQLPQFVLDPVVPGVRARRLSPDRRLLRGD